MEKVSQSFEFVIDDQPEVDQVDPLSYAGEPMIGDHIIAQPGAHFEQIIPSELVDLIVKEVENVPEIQFNSAQIGNDTTNGEFLTVRNSKISWWGESHWVCSIFSHYINLANRSLWEYDLNYLNGIQISTYDEGGHYKWHSDYGTSSDQRYTRKLSASLLITDPSEYEGGDLELLDYHNNILQPPQTKGTMIIFDSRIPHRVTPVTKGKRISLVTWMLGPKLR
jgi:PKHD-type hydroxylase